MSALVWLLMTYSAVTVTLLTITEGIPVVLGMIYNSLCVMALASHAKTSLTDPGSVPIQAIPSERQRLMKDSHSMCGQCQTFKPPQSHHCRICNRCISRMDHHCPWMNNCVGAGNLSTCCCCCSALYHMPFKTLSLSNLLSLPNLLTNNRALSTVLGVHLDVCSVLAVLVWVELLFLRRRRLHVPPARGASGPCDDTPLCGCLSLYLQYAHERMLWSHDGYWDH